MSARQLFILSVLTTLLLVVGLFVAISSSARMRRADGTTNPLRGHVRAVDRLAMFDTAAKFADGKLEHVKVVSDDPARIALDDKRENTFPRYGYWTSPEVPTQFGFTELIPSWNATTPPNTGVRFQARVRDARSGKWSPWLYFGQWGRTMVNRRDDRVIDEFDHGIVYTDCLLLDRPADAYQVRACLQSFDFDPASKPSIRRISVSYSGVVKDSRLYDMLVERPTLTNNWARDLPVPFRAQGDTPPPLKSQTCSPSSVTMVMAYWGVDRPTLENALAIYDSEHDLFGNWSRAAQRAGELGLDAWVTRIRNWDQVRALIAAGQPVIASIQYKDKAEFPSAAVGPTNGHLIVIRGFKENGDVIVNDPASRDKGNGAVYKPAELGKAWFDNAGGVAYIIRGTRPAVAAQAP